MPYHEASLPNLPLGSEVLIKQHWALMVQNQSEDNPGGAETGAQSISSLMAGEDRFAMGICQKFWSVGFYGLRKFLLAESNSIIIQIGPHKSRSFWVQWPILDITNFQKHAGVCFGNKRMSNKDTSGSWAHQDPGLSITLSLPALSPACTVPLQSQWDMPQLKRTQSVQGLAGTSKLSAPIVIWHSKGSWDASWYHPQQMQTCCPNKHEMMQLFQLVALKYPSNMH